MGVKKAEDYSVLESSDPKIEVYRRMELVEVIFEELGLEYFGLIQGRKTWKAHDGFYRVDKMFNNGTQYVIIEWAENEGEGFEDASLIEYNEAIADFYEEICFLLDMSCNRGRGEGCDIIIKGEKMPGTSEIPHTVCFLDVSDNYILCYEFECSGLYNRKTKKINWFHNYHYGDPDLGIIDKNEKFCITVGGGLTYIYDIINDEYYEIETDEIDYIYYIRQIDDYTIEYRVEFHGIVQLDVSSYIKLHK